MMSQLMRYAPVISLIERVRPGHCLEVGCGALGLGRFLSRQFIGVDRDFSDYTGRPRPVSPFMLAARGDGTALPFRNRSVDLVVLVDVLEHLPPEARRGVLAECDRVSRAWIAVAFPCNGRAARHDRELNGWLRARSLPVPGWLDEHLAYPLPKLEDVRRALSRSTRRIRVTDNAWLPVHRLVMRWEAAAKGARYSAAMSDLFAPTSWRWRDHRLVTNLLRGVARAFWPAVRLLERRPGYRKFVVVEKIADGWVIDGE